MNPEYPNHNFYELFQKKIRFWKSHLQK